MKNLFFGLITTCTLALMSYTVIPSTNSKDCEGLRIVECKWRSCITRDGVKYCTEWSYSVCIEDTDGTLSVWY